MKIHPMLTMAKHTLKGIVTLKPANWCCVAAVRNGAKLSVIYAR
jgi:hypothetical protein